MTTETAERKPGAHLAIAGTGRAGTSFLVRYLTELGLDTHLARHGEDGSWDDYANAGLETVPLPDHHSDLPYVVKYPWLHQCIDDILASKTMRLDAVVIPVRDLGEAAVSRTLVELQAMHRSLPWLVEMDQSWEVWGSTPGGLTYSLNPLDQGRLLAVGFHQLIQRLVQADIPIVLLAFPRLVEDPQYLFRKLQPLLPATVSEDIATEAHSRISDLTKVRVGDELAMVGRADAPAHSQVTQSRDQVTQYASHDRLDAIAVRRELARVRKLQSDAEAAAQLARQEVAAATAAAAEATGQAREEARVLKEEARVLREALAGAGRQIAQLSAARSRAATLQCEINAILASRSWRLTRGYRAFGRAIQHFCNRSRRSPPAVSDPAVSPRSSDLRGGFADAIANQWTNWPVWTDENSFRTRQFQFVTSLDKGEGRTENDTVMLLKDRNFVDVIYRNLLLELRPKQIFEIGFYQGGMPLFLADMVAPEKVVGIDYTAPSDELRSLIKHAGLADSVKLHGNMPQNDTALIGQLLDGEFGDQPLDLIVDDASHEYREHQSLLRGVLWLSAARRQIRYRGLGMAALAWRSVANGEEPFLEPARDDQPGLRAGYDPRQSAPEDYCAVGDPDLGLRCRHPR